jgi:hypothetical protein
MVVIVLISPVACFIEALVFLMVNGDHTPVTINGCALPQL